VALRDVALLSVMKPQTADTDVVSSTRSAFIVDRLAWTTEINFVMDCAGKGSRSPFRKILEGPRFYVVPRV
jgi:hypothetical protein